MTGNNRSAVCRLRSVALALAAIGSLAIVSAAGAELRIVGPDQTDVASEVRLLVDGLTAPPADSTMADLQQWASRLVLTVDSPAEADPITDAELSLGLGSGLRLRLYLTPDKPGVYVLVLIDPAKPDNLAVATHRVTAGTVPPDPTPGPGPQPGPGPVKVTKAVILHETSQQTQELATLFLALRQGPEAERLRAAGRTVLILDKDQQSATAYRSQLDGQALPAVLVFDGDDRLVGRHPLPDTAAEVLKLMGG